MSKPLPQQVTQLLMDWSGGDKAALDRLMPVVYDELRRLAHPYMSRERGGHTLQTTALVNEAYLKLIGQRNVSWQNRAHFFAVAPKLMRRILAITPAAAITPSAKARRAKWRSKMPRLCRASAGRSCSRSMMR